MLKQLQNRPPFTIKALIQALKRPKIGPLLQVRFYFTLAFSTFQLVFSLYAQAIGLSSQTTGLLLAYVGILSVIVQGGLIGILTRRFRENALIISGLWVMTGALLAWAFTNQLWLLVLVILPLAVAGGVLNTVIQSAITKSVTRQEVGGDSRYLYLAGGGNACYCALSWWLPAPESRPLGTRCIQRHPDGHSCGTRLLAHYPTFPDGAKSNGNEAFIWVT